MTKTYVKVICRTVRIYLCFPRFRAHFESLLNYIDAGVKEGANLVYGGKRVGDKGNNSVSPTISRT